MNFKFFWNKKMINLLIAELRMFFYLNWLTFVISLLN